MKTKDMNLKYFSTIALAILALTLSAAAADITTLDGTTYADIKDVSLKPGGLFFVVGTGATMRGVTVPYAQLPEAVKDQYHYDPYSMALAAARQNRTINLTRSLAFSLDQLDAAKKKAKDEKKLLGFIMEWDTMFVPAAPMGRGSPAGVAHFYTVFHENMVLVFVRHESELGAVPDAVKQGFNGPEEGGFSPNMAVVTADCAQFICEIPYGGDKSNGQIREQIFRQKIAVIKKFTQAQAKAP